MKKSTQYLTKAPFFDGLSENHLEEINAISIIKKLNKNEFIFSDGDDGNGFYIIIDGTVKIFKVSSDGKEQILHIFNSGDIFGEVPVFSGQSFPANAIALTRSTVLFVPKKKFIALINKNPKISINMLALLSKRLREFTIQIENLTLKEISGRIADYIIHLSIEQNNDETIVLPTSKANMASLLGTIPETLSRIFTKMTEQGLIEVSGKTIQLLSKNKLERVALQGRF
jgi:CRP/FNR family transcriptional regulator